MTKVRSTLLILFIAICFLAVIGTSQENAQDTTEEINSEMVPAEVIEPESGGEPVDIESARIDFWEQFELDHQPEFGHIESIFAAVYSEFYTEHKGSGVILIDSLAAYFHESEDFDLHDHESLDVIGAQVWSSIGFESDYQAGFLSAFPWKHRRGGDLGEYILPDMPQCTSMGSNEQRQGQRR